MHDKRMRALLLAFLVAVSTSAAAQGYPSKPVRFVVPFPGGYGSAGSQVSIATLKAGGGFAAIDVPYKGVPPAVTDLLANQIAYTFADFAVALGQIRGGKLRGLGVTSAARTPLAPEIPAIGEEIPGYEVVLWYGLVAPAGPPREARNRR